MRRLGVLLLLAPALAAPGAARAASFGELPLQTLAPAASCVRPTGAPGELVRWAPRGARVFAAGATASTPVSLGGAAVGCPLASAQPGGAAVLAAPLSEGGLGVALRAPGGGWGAPVTLARKRAIADFDAAASARGDAVVAWLESRERNGDVTLVARVARRAPGGAFGAPVELARWSGFGSRFPRIRAGIDGSGGVVVAWTRPGGSASTRAAAAIAPPGGGFGAPQPFAEDISGDPALAVAPDGRALLSLPGDAMDVAERGPGTAAFAAPVQVAENPGDSAVALRPDGAAVVAWGDNLIAGKYAATRAAPGAFGAPVELEPGPASGLAGESVTVGVGISQGGGAEIPVDLNGTAPRAAFAGDGRAVVTWGALAQAGAFKYVQAKVATIGPAGVDSQALGGPLRDAGSIAPVIGLTGVPALAWGDNAQPAPGHLHVAVEGAQPAPQAPFPDVRLGAARRHGKSVTLPLRCSAACDVRVRLGSEIDVSASLARAGSTTLRLGGNGERIPKPGAKVRVISGPPGATTVQTSGTTLR